MGWKSAGAISSWLAVPALAVAANLVPNSSFEAGVDARLAIGRWHVAGLPAVRLDDGTAVHGRHSLRVPYSRLAFAPAPRDTTGIEIRAAAPVRLTAGQLYSLTASVRSDVPVQGTFQLLSTPPDGRAEQAPVASREVSVGRNWRRVGLSFRSDRDQDVYWDLALRSERPGSLWLDAVQLEAGRITPYAPALPVEAGLRVAAEGAIVNGGDPPVVLVTAFNGAATPARQAYRLRVLDLGGESVHAESLILELQAGESVVREVRLPVLRNGPYKVQLSTGAGGGIESEAHLAVLPPRREVAAADGAFGIYATLAPEPLRILHRAGFTWLSSLTANGRMIYWDLVEPREGEFVWYDDDIRLARSLGFSFMFNLEPCKIPAWALALSKEARIDRWSRYVTAMATHYGSVVRHWTIADEVSQAYEADDWRQACWRTGAEYLPWHLSGTRALRAVDPGAKVLLNASPEAAEELLRALPARSVDILADNAWHVPERMERWPAIASRHGIGEFWAPGVSVNTPSWYAARPRPGDVGASPTSPEYWADRNREVAAGVVRTLAAGARRLFQYTGNYVGNTNTFSLFEADSSLKPIGVQFASLIWLLDGATRATRVPVTGEGRVEAYRFERRDGTVVYPLFGPRAASQLLRLPGLAPGDLRVYDHFANRLTPGSGAGGAIEVPIGRDPVFLATTGEAALRVDRALSGMALRLEALPDAGQVEQAGAYAILRGYSDGLWRPPPNVSLWYRSAALGWTEVLRFRASTEIPAYRVTPDGIEIRWQFTRGPEAFYLEPGQFPAGLLDGATLLGSRAGAGGLEWQSGRLNAAGEDVISARVGTGPAGLREPLTLLVQRPAPAFAVRLRTTLAGPAAAYGEQPAVFGGWQLLARPGADYFLHQSYPAGAAGPLAITVRLDVIEAGATGAGE